MKNEQKPEACMASFISANSQDGFFSLYDEVFAPQKFDKIFIITGGPGTGKSTLLRKIYAEALSWNCESEQILCSSDPGSLDGVILNANGHRIGILDGTPPHGRIPSYPAVTEEIIHLGLLWNAPKLQKSKDDIFALTDTKKHAYRSAYMLLRALGSIEEEERLRFLPYFDEEKATRQIKHRLQAERKKGEQKRRFLRAICSQGEFILPFAEKDVKNLILVGGKESSAETYLSLFAKAVATETLEHTVYLSPIRPEIPDAIYLPQSQTLLIKERLAQHKDKGRRIVADRFFSVSGCESKDLAREKQQLQNAVISRLAEAASAHRAMEALYSGAMDFSRFDDLLKAVIHNVFSLLYPSCMVKEES